MKVPLPMAKLPADAVFQVSPVIRKRTAPATTKIKPAFFILKPPLCCLTNIRAETMGGHTISGKKLNRGKGGEL